MMGNDTPASISGRWSGELNAVVYSTETEKQERAFTLGLAGLLGEGVYNFGELVGFSLLWSPCVGFVVSLFQLKLDHVCCCVFAADASCAGVPEEHRQAVAH